jgi:protein phosphatase
MVSNTTLVVLLYSLGGPYTRESHSKNLIFGQRSNGELAVSRAFGVSDKGRVRKGNEDAFASVDDLQLFIVADGMGGHNAGEVASQLAIEAIVGFVRRSSEGSEFSWPYGIDPNLSYDGNRLRTAIYLANRRVFRAAEANDDYTGMGTTVVCALISGDKLDKLIVGHVGDSRLYMKTDTGLQQLTRDDSWAATILANELGADKAALAKHPMRNVLTNVLGAREQTDIHLAETPLRGSERLLLCSDGLHSALDDRAIDQLLASSADLQATAQALVSAALDGGSRDNVTALVVHCDGKAAV